MLSNEAILERADVVSQAFNNEINGVSHAALTNTAHSILVSDLEGHGNILSQKHSEALYELVGTLTFYVQGVTKGRLAMPLPTGMGKTSAIVAWLTALHRLGLDHVSVAVSASKVEALCSIKKALIEHGVPEAKIGLKHSVGSKASMESTGDSDRLFMLVTHQRVRGSSEHKLFTKHKGNSRDVMIYDESLFRSAPSALSEKEIARALGWFQPDVRDNPKYASLWSYLTECHGLIVAGLTSLRVDPTCADGRKPGDTIINLPEKLPLELNGYLELLGSRVELDSLRGLIEMSQNPLRLTLTSQDDGVVFYRLAVPEDLKNVMILDASHPVRSLVKMDDSIKEGSKYTNDSELKRFDNVTIHQMLTHGGRTSLTNSMGEQRRDKRKVSLEVAEVIKGIPEDEAVLVFTFKRRATDRVDILSILKDDLRAAGIDLESTTPGGKPRINFLTWGDETSLNTVSYCQNVILAGVLHRSHLEIASAMVGQLDNINANIQHKDILGVIDSEIDHLVYQALSRGSCREVNNGQAKPMKAWIIHKDFKLRQRLDRVFPGATWLPWEAVHGAASGGKTATLALQIMDHLNSLPEDVTKVSVRQLKIDLGITEVPNSTFTCVTDLIHESSGSWLKQGRSLVRVGSGFVDESE